MTPYKKRSCPITKRLAEDLMIRNMADATIDAYTYHVRRLADFIKKPLDRVTPEDVRTFQLHLIQDKNLAYSTFNQAVCALRFYYRHTEPMSWPVTMVPFGKRPKTLPVVLSRNEIEKLFQCTTNLKHQTFMMTLYSGGLRFSEAARLKVASIDSQRMMIHIACGKGQKDRFVPLSPRLLEQLRAYWIKYRPTGSLLFPGKTPEKTVCRYVDPQSDQGCRNQSSHQETRLSACAATFLRDGTLGSGSRSVDDQSVAWSLQLLRRRCGICIVAASIFTVHRVHWTGCRCSNCRRTRRPRKTACQISRRQLLRSGHSSLGRAASNQLEHTGASP